MRYYSERDLADLIIHELLHATVWLNNHVQFNEGLATFVGIEGARLFMKQMRGCDGTSDIEAANRLADRAVYHAFIRGLIAELEEMFQSDISREERLRRKDEIISSAQRRFEEKYDELFITDNFRFFIDLPVNNAYLDLFRLYHEGDTYFEDLFERSGRNLKEFIAAARTINPRLRRNRCPRTEFERALGLM